MRRPFVISLVLLAAIGLAGCSTAVDTGASPHVAVSAAPTETPIPEPVTHTVQDLSALTGADASALLQGENLVAVVKSTDGSAVADTTGWTFQSQDPAAGTDLTEGATVTLTFAPPPPPAPAPVAPAPAPAPPAPAPGGGATALCNDGSLSFAAHHQGACSHHGGVAEWYK
ncbi:MAG TPA: DUF3761 domain-containing protein [Lacisediminihabitans sp.]|uniref:DUF3761 domain-containing protein n=1 Tax=Lacisediminihabitans sp. TaxID=2787631 RepID=UPI002EDBA1C4